ASVGLPAGAWRAGRRAVGAALRPAGGEAPAPWRDLTRPCTRELFAGTALLSRGMAPPPATVVFVGTGKEQRRPGQQVHPGGQLAQGELGRCHPCLLGSDGGAFGLPVLSSLGVELGAGL